jgi:hypothetical protein
MRYEGTLNRSYDRAFKQLHVLQSARHRVQPNEPKPDPGLTPVTPRLVNPIPAPNAGRRRACPPPPSSELSTDSTPTTSSSESPAKPTPPNDGDLDL